MVLTLTRGRTEPRDPHVFPTLQLTLLALVRVAEPIALTSIFPYAYKLALHFEIGDKNNASFYAGLLISAFALAESATGMFWGGLSDRYGRKPILLLGCVGTIISLLLVGFAASFWMALVGRAVGGLLNGNIGVIQTMVGELVTLPEHEPKAFAIMPFVWSIGTIIGPAVGGYFSTPSETFPDTFSSHGLFAKFPFLLPNLICASLLLVAIIAGSALIEETHPDMQPWSTKTDLAHTNAHTPLMATAGATEHAPANLMDSSYGTFNQIEDEETQDRWRVKQDGRPSSIDSSSKGKAFTRRVIMLTVALGIFTYHSMTYDVLLPIFLGDERVGDGSTQSTSQAFAGGLGFDLQEVGIIMAFNGIIALFVQGVIFPAMASWLGIWKLFVMVTIGHPIAYFIVPYLVLIPVNMVTPAIYVCLAIRNFFSILAYPVLLILLKEASPGPSALGKINGLAASTGAACRTMASPIGGYLYGLGVQIDFTPLSWWASAIVAVGGAVQVFFMRTQRDKVTVHNLTRHMSRESLHGHANREVVRIKVDETIYEESEHSDEEASLLGREHQAPTEEERE